MSGVQRLRSILKGQWDESLTTVRHQRQQGTNGAHNCTSDAGMIFLKSAGIKRGGQGGVIYDQHRLSVSQDLVGRMKDTRSEMESFTQLATQQSRHGCWRKLTQTRASPFLTSGMMMSSTSVIDEGVAY
jgi:hypothetical protein